MTPDQLVAAYGPLRCVLLAEMLRSLSTPQTAEAIAFTASPALMPVTPELVRAVADTIGYKLATTPLE